MLSKNIKDSVIQEQTINQINNDVLNERTSNTSQQANDNNKNENDLATSNERNFSIEGENTSKGNLLAQHHNIYYPNEKSKHNNNMFTSSSPVNKCNINVTTRKPIKKRPQVCITENYIKQQENQARKPDVVPGIRS